MLPIEGLGTFYLGKGYDPASSAVTEELLLYDAKDLTTHGVIIGMTGSGKTGLAVGLLEEALLDGIPGIIIDPKGDMPNLMLSFPDLAPEDFLPWVNPREAAREGISPDEYARKTAEVWKAGLGKWGIEGDRIRRFRDAGEIVLYTPGSSAGRPVSALRSFQVPPKDILEDSDLFTERIQTTTSGILSLLGIAGDPLTSREHILISMILEDRWKQGMDLDLPGLIAALADPPFTQVGVLPLETFYPSKDRMELILGLNNLLAAPGFASWLEGDPMDIPRFLFSPEGKPRLSIFTISHLSERERMFFVSLLLNQILGWARTQPGTSTLRALLYMDEIFGFFPPVQEPPSKKTLLTLLKQARAYGLGVLLATQNPVDLDYRGLSNTGTWFIGRLQTAQDRERVLSGLESATPGGLKRAELDELIAGIGKRVFLMQNIHEDRPFLFHTRWAMSYLAGPMTREQVRVLSEHTRSAAADGGTPVIATPRAAATKRPVLPEGVTSLYPPVSEAENIVYRPYVGGFADVHYHNARWKVDESREIARAVAVDEGPVPVDWSLAFPLEMDPSSLAAGLPSTGELEEIPESALKPKKLELWGREFLREIRRGDVLTLYRNNDLKLVSEPGESLEEFSARVSLGLHEERDSAVEALRRKYASKFTTLENRLMRARQAVEREEQQAGQKKMDTVISFGSTIAGALLGRKIGTYSASRMGTALSKAGRMRKEQQDIARARETAESVEAEIAELETRLQEEVDAIRGSDSPGGPPVEEISVRPRAGDISLRLFGIIWLPWKRTAGGGLEPLWRNKN